MVDPLERSVISYMHGQFILVDEQSNVADAVKEMKLKKAETIIVIKDGKKLVGIVTDSDILDRLVMKGEDSDQNTGNLKGVSTLSISKTFLISHQVTTTGNSI